MLLTMCMLAEPSVMAMAKSESEVQEAETNVVNLRNL